jgi:hypothetical protein
MWPYAYTHYFLWMTLNLWFLVTHLCRYCIIYSATNLCTYTGHHIFQYLLLFKFTLKMCTELTLWVPLWYLLTNDKEQRVKVTLQNFWSICNCAVAYEKHNKFHVFLQQIWVHLYTNLKRRNNSISYHHVVHFHQCYQPLYRHYFLLLDCLLHSRWSNCCSVTDATACTAVLSMATKNNLCALALKENTKQHAILTFQI